MAGNILSGRTLRLIAVSVWPLLGGIVLDIIDFIFLGDALQGAGWSIAGSVGVVTASLPPIAACYFFRVRTLSAYLFTSLSVGGIIAAIIAVLATIHMDPLGFGTIFYLGAILVLGGSGATGWMLWLIRRPDRDAEKARHEAH
jgi:hypothetical protein